MADVKKLAPIIFGWEGGLANDPMDRGGLTNMGVTLDTWRAVGYDKTGDGVIDGADLKLLDKKDVINVLKKHYWDRWKGDHIRSQSLANILVDWVWASGAWGIKIPQRLLGVPSDGVVGPMTLSTLNEANARNLFFRIKEERIRFVEDICRKDPTQVRFRKGWLNRINSFQFNDAI